MLPVLAVMLLTEPLESVRVAVEADDVADDRGKAEKLEADEAGPALITSRTSDFDRQEGVVMFEGDVVVRYSDAYVMCADRLYIFLAGSNELSRVVAAGNVSVTNLARSGTCAMATYRRRKNEIEMFGDAHCRARLVEGGKTSNTLEGRRIKFWLDSEQVEVDDSGITVQKEGAKKLR